jgi:NitT/TauT family transport system permease protein
MMSNRQFLSTLAAQVLLVTLVLLTWQLASGPLIDELLISKPTAVWQRFLTMVETGELGHAVYATTKVVVAGLFWGTLAGVAVGTLVALSRAAGNAFVPIIEALFSIPKIALVPLFTLWFGLDSGQRIAITATVVFFFMFFATENGIRRVPKSLRESLQILGASTPRLIWTLYLPASLGWIIGGLRISAPYAFVAAVSAEVISSNEGLGALVKINGTMLDSAGMFVGVVAATLLAALFGGAVNLIYNLTQHRLGKF